MRGRIFSAVEVARPKPAPDLFLHAARTMGVEPGDCAVVAKLGATVFDDMRELPNLLTLPPPPPKGGGE